MARFRIGIVGAGIAGLAAAREISTLGEESLVFDKSNHVGGRISTLKFGEYIFDTGATSITPRGRSLEKVMLEELPRHDLVKIEKPLYTHSFGRVRPGVISKIAIDRYVYQSGIVELPILLSKNLNIQLDTHVGQITEKKKEYLIDGKYFDGLILTLPIPYTKELLESLNEVRPLSNSHYRPCLSLLIAYDYILGDFPFHAVVDQSQQHPLTWLSFESLKCLGRAPEGYTTLVAQMNPSFSRTYYDQGEEKITQEILSYLEHLFGPKMRKPVFSKLKKWRFSQPETASLFENVNRPNQKILLATDGITGGRIEMAYESGIMAARQLVQTLSTID